MRGAVLAAALAGCGGRAVHGSTGGEITHAGETFDVDGGALAFDLLREGDPVRTVVVSTRKMGFVCDWAKVEFASPSARYADEPQSP